MAVYGATLHYPAAESPGGKLEPADYYFASIDGENWVAVSRLPQAEDEDVTRALIEGDPYDPDKDDGSWRIGYTLDQDTNRVRPILFSTWYLEHDTKGTVEFHEPIGEKS